MRNISILLFLSVFTACAHDVLLQSNDVESEGIDIVASQIYEEGFVRVLVSDALSGKMEAAVRAGELRTRAMDADEFISQVKIRSIQRTFPDAGRFEERTRIAGLHLWYDVIFDTNTPLKEAEQNLSKVKGIKKVELRPIAARYWDDNVVEFTQNITQNVAEPNAVMPFNDPSLSNQWNYYNDGSLGDKYRSGADINLFGAWNYTTGSSDVIVAVIDGGIDYTHEDLVENMWVNSAEKNGTPSVDDDKNGYKDDVYGYNFVSDIGKLVPTNHGTHVAGIIAATSNNGKGIAGIAGGNGQKGSGVRLMSCQIFVEEDDPYSGNAGRFGAKAIKYAADNGAVICQNSWGYPSLTQIPASDKAAIDYFIEYAGINENGQQTGPMRGGIVIFAVGNEDRAEAAPANYDKVVAVTSIAPDFRKAYYSNYGEWTDIAAPGGDVQSFGNKGTIYSTVVNGYGYMQGTSMACPHVSGVAALVLSHFKRSGYNPGMLRAKIEGSAMNIDSYNSSYKGKLGKLVNALASLAEGSTTPPNGVGTVSGSVRSNTVTLKWTVPGDPDDGKASGFNVYYRKTSLAGLNAFNPPPDVMILSFTTGNLSVGEQFEAEIARLEFNMKYYFMVNAFDYSGNFSPLSSPISLTTASNTPPVITSLDNVDLVIKKHETVVLRFLGNDPDGHDITWSLHSSLNGVELVDLGEGQAQLTISGEKSEAGVHEFELFLEDEYGAFVSQKIKYEVFENQAPEIIDTIADLYFDALNEESSFPISKYFTDPDGETLKYTFNNSAPNVVNVNESKGQIHIVSLAYGLAQIEITATDVMGLSVSQTFRVLVRDGSQEIDVYPNPVKDYMWLRTGVDTDCSVVIVNNAGVKVFEDEVHISPFDPVKIDMGSFSAGLFSVVVKFGDKELKKEIIKL